jgi:hypothetical protein
MRRLSQKNANDAKNTNSRKNIFLTKWYLSYFQYIKLVLICVICVLKILFGQPLSFGFRFYCTRTVIIFNTYPQKYPQNDQKKRKR